MKIVHICLSGRFNENWGYQENILSKFNVRSGHDVTVIASNQVDDTKKRCIKIIQPGIYQLDSGVKIRRITYKKEIPNYIADKLKLYCGLEKALYEEKPDLIFHHGSMGCTLLTVKKYKKSNKDVKLIIDNHADKYNCGKSFFSKYVMHRGLWHVIMRSTIPYVHKYYGVLPIRCDFLNKVYGIPKEKIDLMIMGVDDEEIYSIDKKHERMHIRERYGIKEEDFLIVSGGKINRAKNIHLLMEAVNNLNISNLKLLIFGQPEKEMENEIQALTSDKIYMIGWISSKEVYKFFAAADLACFPGTHSVLWEQACAMGLPCIFNYMEKMQHVDVGGNCIFIKNPKTKNLEKVLMDLLKDKNKYQKMKEVAETSAYKEFLYSKIETKMYE